MTLNSSAWAIDGALMQSALARRAEYAATGGNQGIVNKDALRVIPLAVPGVGLQITDGSGLVLNRYQSSPNETYTVSNPGNHTVTPDQMPPASTSARSFILAVTIGDPEFSQTGHPWMRADLPAAGEEERFQYVRPVLVQVSAGARRLSVNYPALELARIDIPANTTTITSAMITDLRELAQPRSFTAISHVTASGTNPLRGLDNDWTKWERWPNYNVMSVRIPSWAVVAKVTGFIEGIRLKGPGTGWVRAALVGGGYTPGTNIEEQIATAGKGGPQIQMPDESFGRRAYNIGGEIDIPVSLRGTAVFFIVEGRPANARSQGFLETVPDQTSAMLSVTFEEIPT